MTVNKKQSVSSSFCRNDKLVWCTQLSTSICRLFDYEKITTATILLFRPILLSQTKSFKLVVWLLSGFGKIVNKLTVLSGKKFEFLAIVNTAL